MYLKSPLLSIVIANYNYGRFLEDAIKSVIAQKMWDKVELIICDAASTDNSVEIIRKFANGLPPNTSRYEWENSENRLMNNNQQILTTNDKSLVANITWWCSEKDSGQSAAFNKGFSHACGRFLTWLNADDIMLPGTIQSFKSAVENNPNKEWFSGETVYVDVTGNIVTSGLATWSALFRFMRIPPWARITAPATFFSRSLFEKVGGFDEKLRYVMDTDLWIKFTQLGYDVHYLRIACWAFRLHEESKTSASVTTGKRNNRFLDERILIRKRAGITPIKNSMAEYGKKFCCVITLSYLRRAKWLKKTVGKNFMEIFSKNEGTIIHED